MTHKLLSQLVEAHAAKAAAEEARLATMRFMVAASHDLRQPMHALEFFVDALEGHPGSLGAREIVGNIRQSVRALADLLKIVLDISRLDSGAVQTSISTVPVAPILGRVLRDYEALARRKGLHLRAMRTALFVRTDPLLLERIIRNLVSNAVRYTDRGGVVIGCRREGQSVRIEVWDSGHGIPADRHLEIFREFGQLENPEHDRNKGLGLGLAIVERLSRLLGHPLRLRSIPGRGSVFIVTVPRGRPADHVPDSLPELINKDMDVAGSVVIVIDDDIAVRQAMQTLLHQWGCSAVLVASGADLRRRIAELSAPLDLILTEYRLRHAHNGVQLIRRLREELNADIPAVVVTGDTTLEVSEEVQSNDIRILHKPVRPARLRALIAHLRSVRTR